MVIGTDGRKELRMTHEELMAAVKEVCPVVLSHSQAPHCGAHYFTVPHESARVVCRAAKGDETVTRPVAHVSATLDEHDELIYRVSIMSRAKDFVKLLKKDDQES
jgi:hypothetical protein